MKTAVIDVRMTEARFSKGFYVVAMIDDSCGGKGEENSSIDRWLVSKKMRVMVKPVEHEIGR